jgi:hypothetical protein
MTNQKSKIVQDWVGGLVVGVSHNRSTIFVLDIPIYEANVTSELCISFSGLQYRYFGIHCQSGGISAPFVA